MRSPTRGAVLGTSLAGGVGRTGVDAPDAAPVAGPIRSGVEAPKGAVVGTCMLDAPDAAPVAGSICSCVEAPKGAVVGTCMLGSTVGRGLHAPAARLASSSSAVPGERHACG